MSSTAIAPDTTELEEECMDRLLPWKCYSDNLRRYEEYPSLQALAEAKSMSVSVIMDAIANHKGNLYDMHIVKR
jgi:hypothetical protein